MCLEGHVEVLQSIQPPDGSGARVKSGGFCWRFLQNLVVLKVCSLPSTCLASDAWFPHVSPGPYTGHGSIGAGHTRTD